MKKVCKWYQSCPIKYIVDHRMLNKEWVEDYCLIGNKKCFRYQKEESGELHPDNLLPNGEIRKELK